MHKDCIAAPVEALPSGCRPDGTGRDKGEGGLIGPGRLEMAPHSEGSSLLGLGNTTPGPGRASGDRSVEIQKQLQTASGDVQKYLR